jgi:hypothetical protein
MATQAVHTAGQNAAYRLACGMINQSDLLDSIKSYCYTFMGEVT